MLRLARLEAFGLRKTSVNLLSTTRIATSTDGSPSKVVSLDISKRAFSSFGERRYQNDQQFYRKLVKDYGPGGPLLISLDLAI